MHQQTRLLTRAHAQMHIHTCFQTVWFEYIPVSVCLPVQRKKFSSWLALQLWKSLFCTSSFLKKQLPLVSKCGLQISSISIPQTVDQMSQGHHGMFEIWNTATFDICQALQTTSLMLLNFNMIALHPFDDVISLPSWVFGVVTVIKNKYHMKMTEKEGNNVQ